MMYRSVGKRTFDFIAAFCMLVVLFPIILLTALAIILTNRKSGLFFIQQRPGMNTKIFRFIKFKTMTDAKDQNGNLLPDASRLTRIGKFLRATSLDELPQLINVIKGEMSLVGPRPLLLRYLPLYSAKHARRHEVRPGITGWSQVNGRNAISWPEKLDLDVWYVDHLSFKLDVEILWNTLIKVIKREGITAVDSASGVPFNGYKNVNRNK